MLLGYPVVGEILPLAQLRSAAFGARLLLVMAAVSALGLAVLGSPANAANGSVVYTYDALGRVTTAAYDTGVIVIYTYDSNGNRTSQTINVNTGTLSWTATATPCTANCWGTKLWH